MFVWPIFAREGTMEFTDLINSRHSVRHYTPELVAQEHLEKILEAGRLAPTGANRQPQRLIVVQRTEGLQKLQQAANTFGAPLAIIVCTDTAAVWQRKNDGKKITDIDASIVTTHMMLAATDLGLGSVWVCQFRADLIREAFNLPDTYEPVNILIIGHTDESADSQVARKTRKPLTETVIYEQCPPSSAQLHVPVGGTEMGQ